MAVATSAVAPRLDEDGELLLTALARAGADPHPAVWDDPAVDWPGFDGVLVRSVWDYPSRRESFLTWSRACRKTANPQDVLTWNTDKHYLGDLSAAGVPAVPTVFVPPGMKLEAPAGDYVLKPTVGGSAADTGRFRGPDRRAADLVERLHAQGRSVLVQPYLPGIEADGETSLVFLGGSYSHAVRREPLLTGLGERRPVVVADVLSTIRPVQPSPAQHEVARRALAAVPGGGQRLSYARVDLIPGPTGPVLLELEATDCFLFLSSASAGAVSRLADHVVTRLGRDVDP
jgi:glutathione synthase/RimK-type ligase-like ATP-grasp enzyme